MNRVGSYWGPEHTSDEHRAYLKAVGGPIRILEPDVQQVVDAASYTSDEVWPRWWRLDDNDYKVLDGMIADPEGSGERLALAMLAEAAKMRRQAQERELVFPDAARLRFSGINEPPVWTDSKDEFIRHEVRFLDTLTAHGAKSLAMRLGVGWPGNGGIADHPPIWDEYEPIYQAIQRADGLSLLELHEYWYWTGPQEGWGWLAGRHWQCPWDVPISIGECGIDNYVDKARWDTESHRRRGWQGNVSAQEYVAQFDWYWRNLDHSRVRVILPYMLDYRANMWDSFDIFPARHEFAAWVGQLQQPPQTPQQPVDAPGGAFKVFIPAAPKNAPVDAPRDSGRTPVTTIDPRQQISASSGLAWWFVGEMGRVLGIDPDLAQAFLSIESGIAPGQTIPADPMVIRFEPHIFAPFVAAEVFDRHFQVGSAEQGQLAWDGRYHRFRTAPDQPWQEFHGNQAKEHAVLNLAYSLNPEGAYRSISMGAGQIMGFNFATVGYESAAQMFAAYNDPQTGPLAQVVGFYAYCVNRSGLLDALRAKDFDAMARLYNGEGQVPLYSRLIRARFEEYDAD